MNLPLYSSLPRGDIPNLIGMQDEGFRNVPTVLVCPIKAGMDLTPARLEIPVAGKDLVACPELTRPIRRTGLRFLGRLDEDASHQLMHAFLQLLAR